MMTRRLLLLGVAALVGLPRGAKALSIEEPNAAIAAELDEHRNFVTFHQKLWRKARGQLIADGHEPEQVDRVLAEMRCPTCGDRIDEDREGDARDE